MGTFGYLKKSHAYSNYDSSMLKRVCLVMSGKKKTDHGSGILQVRLGSHI